jgi:hypothetical protein
MRRATIDQDNNEGTEATWVRIPASSFFFLAFTVVIGHGHLLMQLT